MEYYIIEKSECVDDKVVHTPYGYTLDQEKKALVEESAVNFTNWCRENIDGLDAGTTSPSMYFDDNYCYYSCGWTTTSIDGIGVEEVTDFSFLGGK